MDAMDAMDIMDSNTQTKVSESNPISAPKAANALSKLFESDSETENHAQPAKTAPSKLLAQLKPQLDGDSSESSDEEDDGNAYERVRKMLLSASTDATPQKDSEQTSKQNTVSSSDEDEDMPVRRQRVTRREKSRSPRLPSSASARSRTPSPGLFVTPEASPVKHPFSTQEHNSDLEERVKRIRADRLAKQKEQQQEKRSKKTPRREHAGSGSDSDENGRRLTQSSRPTRKAGKKALEDIAREQQRISRNMQLTHQAKTKKKYSIKDLLPKFGLAQHDSELVPAPVMPTPEPSSVVVSSDGEPHDTPPSSPPNQDVPSQKQPAAPTPKLDKGKGRAPEFQHLPPNPVTELYKEMSQKAPVEKAPVEKAPVENAPVDTEMVELSDSEDEVNTAKPRSRFPVFDRLPQNNAQSAPQMVLLRRLAHLPSPGKNGHKGRKMTNMAELNFSLAQKARAQAQKEREEKIADLRRRGVYIETEEEREKRQLEIEDLAAQFEKAREEDLKLAKMERAEAKKNGEMEDLPSSDESEDEDFVGSGEEGAGSGADDEEDMEEEAELELSGSEDENEEEEMETSNGLVDDAAEESHEEGLEEADADDDLPQHRARKQTGRRSRNVVVDDEDEDAPPEPSLTAQATPLPSQTQQDDAMAAFGFQQSSPSLGLTQMFAGTMAALDSNVNQAHPLDHAPEQDSMDFFRSLPDTQPNGAFTESADFIIPNSQVPASQQTDTFGISQLMQTPQTQQVEEFEPTQDAGFQLSRSPAGLGQPASTIDTVMMTVAESPIAKRKGRLHRGRPTVAELSDIDDDADVSEAEVEDVAEPAASEDAFAILAKAAKRQKRLAAKFNKKTSWARDAVQEQAEESEDEYAGLGGASDEDSGEDDEELAKMIDTNDVKVDERKLAAYYAEKGLKEDAKDVNQLYKDIMNGGLRRRRGGDAFDVSDPEDELEQARRRKQRQFQQMTKAILSDEKISKLHENPKQRAFFLTIADHMEDPEYDFLDADVDVAMNDSQSPTDEANEAENGAEVAIPDSQTVDEVPTGNPLKRKSPGAQEKENRPPPHLRRTVLPDNISRKPMTIADVQHSLLELLDDPRVVVPDSQYSDSDSELEIDPPLPAVQRKVVDRLTMTRTSLTETTADGHVAFHAGSGATLPGFRVPSLVRRATSNLSSVSTSTSGTTTPVEGSGIRRGGTGRSNIHAQAREAERRAAVEKAEKRRKETIKKKVNKAQGRRSILRCLADDGFE